jgi:ABC-type uncharacterized transport system involved in gliding motility auxiliary subunit
LIIVGVPDSLSQAQITRLQTFLDSGSVLLMANGMNLMTDAPIATGRGIPWNVLLRLYGVSIGSDMVYDLASNVQVGVPSQFGQVVMPYPLWVRALSTRASSVNAELDAMLLPWASTIDTSQAPPGTVTPLFTTSRAGGVRTGQVFLNPSQEFSRDSLARRLVAVQVNVASKGRLIVVGSADFASDRYLRGGEASVIFVQNAVDWLAQDEALIAIRSKDRTPPPLLFTNNATREAVKYGNLIGIPLVLIAMGAARLWRRRLLTRQVYRARTEAPPA